MWAQVMPRERLLFGSRRLYDPHRLFQMYLHHYELASYKGITTYNNYYEFSLEKKQRLPRLPKIHGCSMDGGSVWAGQQTADI